MSSTEFEKDCANPVIDLMPDQRGVKDKGGTMRLGAYPCSLKAGSHALELYKSEQISERHRHRFEFNNEYREQLTRMGLVLSGTSPDDRLVEIVELPEHPLLRRLSVPSGIQEPTDGRSPAVRGLRGSGCSAARRDRRVCPHGSRANRVVQQRQLKLRVRRVLETVRGRARCACCWSLRAEPKPPARTALYGNLAELKRDIQSAQQAGKLDHDAVVKLARAVAERELTSAEGTKRCNPRPLAARLAQRPLRSAMERRAARANDDVAAELTLILLEMHAAGKTELLHRYARSESGAWRAVAARAAERPIDTDMRKAFFVDPDERVRRAAFRTALAVHDARELEALLEAARVDPDPQSQSSAIVAAGSVGGERAVLALKDLWAQADDITRIAIVDAWTEHASFASGGARELTLAAEGDVGLAAVSASYALSRAGGAEAALANARLRRYIADGSDDEKRLALSVAPMNSETEAAIAKAAKEASPGAARRRAHAADQRRSSTQ